VAFPIRRDRHRERILQDLETYLADDTQAWELGRDGMYRKVEGSKDSPVSAQAQLLARYAAGSTIKL
jgi:polyphosphate kinase